LRLWTLEKEMGFVVRCVIAVVARNGSGECGNSFQYQTFNHRATLIQRKTDEISGLT